MPMQKAVELKPPKGWPSKDKVSDPLTFQRDRPSDGHLIILRSTPVYSVLLYEGHEMPIPHIQGRGVLHVVDQNELFPRRHPLIDQAGQLRWGIDIRGNGVVPVAFGKNIYDRI